MESKETLERKQPAQGTAQRSALLPFRQQELRMSNDNKNPNQRQPGEKPEGKFHYKPGNQSGKTVEPVNPDVEGEGRKVNPKE